MEDEIKQIWNDVRKGVIDINNQDLFLGLLSKSFLYNINQKLSLRGIPVPHYILNTGDDIMYLEAKGQDHSIERPALPGQTPVVSNENYVYSQIPRCMVQPAGLNIPGDQLTSPYSYGRFEFEHEDMIYVFRSEFRRIPLDCTYSLKYYLDSFTDAMSVTQQIITKLAFINTFDFTYLGNIINASYKIPDDFQTEFMLEFDGATTDNKARQISLELQVSTNIPIIYPETIIPADKFITKTVVVPFTEGDKNALTVDDINALNGRAVISIYPKGGIEKAQNGERVDGVDHSNPVTIKPEE